MIEAVQSSRPSRRERRKVLFTTLTGVFMLLYAVSIVADLALADVNLFWLTAVFVIGAIAAACGWARTLDEAKMSAHYVAWFWGGSLGLSVSALVALALGPTMMTPGGVEALLPAAFEPVAANLAFSAGFMLGIVPAAVGYLIWWGVLWARSR
jgi:hypothetical protein